MTAALAHQGPFRSHQAPPRWSREELLELLAEVREELIDADHGLCLALLTIKLLCQRGCTPPDPSDERAERRILGALLVGRATPADVAGVEVGDFHGPCFLRQHLFVAALVVGEHLRAMPPGWGRRKRAEALVRRLMRSVPLLRRRPCPEVADELAALPWPAACPVEEIATVRALGRWRRGLA